MQSPNGFQEDKGAGGYSTYTENQAAYMLVQKWHATKNEVPLFVTDTANVLLLTKKTHTLGTTHSMVDGLSQTLLNRALSKAEEIKENEIVIVGNTERSVLDQKVLSLLKNRWEFIHLETVGPVSAFLLKFPKSKS